MTTDPITSVIADFIVEMQFDRIPEEVVNEAHRTLLNWMGVAIGGCRHPSVDIVLETMASTEGPASILGRVEKTDSLTAALVNGISSHVFDFDDTHLETAIHPAGPVLAAILPIVESRNVQGKELINALIIGIDVTCRLGLAVTPNHYDIGWHISGTAGIFGAAAAASRLLESSAKKTRWALGLAATQSSGIREMFGSMCKSFHIGNAAKNGLMSAMLAKNGFTSSEQGIEAKRGWANVTSSKQNFRAVTNGLGKDFFITKNSYKPYACGVVVHPGIDGCIQLRNQYSLLPSDIKRVDLKVHPLVLELTGKITPKTGLEGKFSIYHACAVALRYGKGGEDEFSDRAVNDPVIKALRDRVKAEVDGSIPADGMVINITKADGSVIAKDIKSALGSLQNPLGDDLLNEKTSDLCRPIIGKNQTKKLIESCRNMAHLKNASVLLKATTPS